MLNDRAVPDHYLHGDLLAAIEGSLGKLGKTVDEVTINDLAPVDEFHIGGKLATEHLMDQLNFSPQDDILDVGCGLGGAARYVASNYGTRVTGIDLSREYVETGKALCAWVKLGDRVTLEHGSATAMPFREASFSGGYMLHVGMNKESSSIKIGNMINNISAKLLAPVEIIVRKR